MTGAACVSCNGGGPSMAAILKQLKKKDEIQPKVKTKAVGGLRSPGRIGWSCSSTTPAAPSSIPGAGVGMQWIRQLGQGLSVQVGCQH